jgi:hypothetical protein
MVVPAKAESSSSTMREKAILYQLQERCGTQAAKVFAEEYQSIVSTESGQTRFNYESHYNSRLNKYFFLEISHTYERGKTSYMLRLFDLNENKEYGSFSSILPMLSCEVQDQRCRSENEWRELMRPYMED